MIDTQAEVARFSAAFQAQGDPERARGQQAYMKCSDEFFGIRAPVLHSAAREFKRSHPQLGKQELFELVEALWATSYFDLHTLGIALLERYITLLDAGDIDRIESLLRRSSTWAHVDYLSTKVSAALAACFPKAINPVLERWAADPYFWLRRAAMLSLLPELRAGAGSFELFARFAATMIEDKEFFIRKAIGWVLREVSKQRPELVEAFLSRHLDKVSGLTLREGSKYLPSEQRALLLRRYKARSG